MKSTLLGEHVRTSCTLPTGGRTRRKPANLSRKRCPSACNSDCLPTASCLQAMLTQAKYKKLSSCESATTRASRALTKNICPSHHFGYFRWIYCIEVLPWPKKSLQPRYSWDWSAVRSWDIMRHRLQSATWARDAQIPRVASMSNRSSISHDITWSNCRSTSWISRL